MLAGSTADRIGRKRVFMAGPGRLHDRLGRCAPLAPEPRLADRLPHGAGGRRLDAQPGRDVDHHQHLHGPARACPRDRGLGRGRRHLDGRGAAGRRPARGLGRLALDLLDQPAGGPGRPPAHPAVRPRVPRAQGPPPRPGRPAPGDRAVRLPDVRDHRGADARRSASSPRLRGRRRSPRCSACSGTSPGATNPSSTCGSSGRRRSAGPR